MSVESERRDENREVVREGAAEDQPRPDVVVQAGDEPEAFVGARSGSLQQRLIRLEVEDQSGRDEAVPSAQSEPFVPSSDRAPPPPGGPRLKALVLGFAASLAFGLLLVAWIKADVIAAAWQSGPKSTIDLYPPRQTEAASHVAVTVAETPAATVRHQVQASVIRPLEPVAHAELSQPCGAAVTEAQPGILQLHLLDAARAGSSITFKVDDLDYRASFASDGELVMFAPRLSLATTVRWSLADGSPCSTSLAEAGAAAQVRVALAWNGATRLALHILEPKGWVGAPVGHISAERPNLSQAHGAGQMHTFGTPADPLRVQVYLVDLARLGPAGVLTAIVTLEPAASLHACAEAGQPQIARYQLYTLRTDRTGDGRPEVRSLAFEFPPCGRGAPEAPPVERIAIKF